MATTYIKMIVHNILCMTLVGLWEIVDKFLVGQVSTHFKNITIAIFLDTVNVINVKLCMMIPHIGRYLFIALLMIFTAVSNSFN